MPRPKLPKLPRGLPRPPKLSGIIKKANPVREVIDDARELIKSGREDIRGVASSLRVEEPKETSSEGKTGITTQETEETAEIEPQSRTASPTPGVSDTGTLHYQLNHLVAVLTQLEIHLSEGLKIMGVPCDCGFKHALQARTFAMETIPIAARMGKDTVIYQDIASWAPYIEEIDTPEKIESGDYDEIYRKESGTASKFRKQVQSMLGDLKKGEDCPGCEEMRETITSFIEKRKRERGGEQ